MIPDKLPRRVHSLPKILLSLLLLACSTGASAQDPAISAFCDEVDPECSQVNAAKPWLDQQQQSFMCDNTSDDVTCVEAGIVKSDNGAICRDIGQLETGTAACQSAWLNWLTVAIQGMFNTQAPPKPTCGAAILGQIASFKSNYSFMFQSVCSATPRSPPPPPPPPAPPPPENCGINYITGQKQC